MTGYRIHKSSRRRFSKPVLFLGITAFLITLALIFGLKGIYERSLQPVNASNQTDIPFVVETGASVPEIAESLHDKDLIRSSRAFIQYVRSKDLGESFIAGTYSLRQSYDVPKIVDMMVSGEVDEELFTILPGQTVEQIKQAFTEAGYTPAEVNKAFEPAQYANHPALVDKPAKASLEGFLYPDSYQKIAETTPQTIIKQSLDEMAEALTPTIRKGISEQGLSVYEGIILASIVEREVGARDKDGRVTDNRAKAAQVFIKRLNEGIMLQSNATDDFPAEYDTYSIAGLPPGPISNVTTSSLNAVAKPAKSNYLYFVSGKDCVTRFSETIDQHENLKSQHGVAQPEDNCRG